MQAEVKATEEHCKYCLDVLEAKLNKKTLP